ncbi:MAG: Ppx/GppA family phosphatase [Deltaproteobacteria bacterium]|nr:Ppx/GppA family phosphatase [Deltaproteobacteria bacterium]
MRLATIDIGTNSILLLVVDLSAEGDARVLEDRCRIERLGHGVDRTGLLDDASIQRALEALREYAGVIRAHDVDTVAAVATQALREVRNGVKFLGPAQEILGAPVEVITGRREAELAFRAVMQSFPQLSEGPLVVCDIGGGSTELIVGRQGVVESLVSLPVGSVRMTERFLSSDPPSTDQAHDMIRRIDEELAKAPLPGPAPLVGVAGTVTTLAAVSIGLEPYEADRVQGMRLRSTEVERQVGEYLRLPVAKRRKMKGLEPKRADVIPAGAAILARVMARMGAREVIVSDRGIRWGLALERASIPRRS